MTDQPPELYDFHLRWHDALLADYAVTGRSMRAGAAFDRIGKVRK